MEAQYLALIFLTSSRGNGFCGVQHGEAGDATRLPNPARPNCRELYASMVLASVPHRRFTRFGQKTFPESLAADDPKFGRRGSRCASFPSLECPERTLAHWMSALTKEQEVVDIRIVLYKGRSCLRLIAWMLLLITASILSIHRADDNSNFTNSRPSGFELHHDTRRKLTGRHGSHEG
jgi:hypothetical protein